jgi:hypothetical protein
MLESPVNPWGADKVAQAKEVTCKILLSVLFSYWVTRDFHYLGGKIMHTSKVLYYVL